MNLTTAKATRRLKEVGIKKIVGASRSSLVFQYLFEALVISFFSIFIAVILVNIILPQFNEITDKNLVLIFNKRLILSILGMGLFTGLLAGSFPAFYISGLHAKDLFKGRISSSFNELWARKSLVVFQFSLSVIFIVSVLVIYNQLKFVQSANLGYERENIIYFAREGKLMDSAYLPTFLEELKNIPGIVEASTISHDMTGHNSGTTKIFWEGKNIEDKTEFERVMVNYNMVEALGLKMKSGRTFSKDFLSDETSIILNEAAIKHMDMEDPIGKTIKLDGSDMQIIGVVRDFNFESLHNYVKPLFLKLSPAETRLIMVKFFRSNEKQVLGRISAFYLKYNPGFSLEYQFLAANYQMQYETEQGMSTLSKYFAGLAIIISCLGLIGLAAFNTERRVKEIGIRKVLGASEFNIVRILSMDFTRLILISILIGTPTSYFILNSWLSGFAYRIELEWWYFLSTGIIILILSWLTIGLQTIKAATVDPVKNLRTE